MIEQVVRWATVVAGLLTIGWAVAVIQEAGKFREPSRYVRSIATSYVVLVAVTTLRSFEDAHADRLVLAMRFVALCYSLTAVASMYLHFRYPRRVRRHSEMSRHEEDRLSNERKLRDGP